MENFPHSKNKKETTIDKKERIKIILKHSQKEYKTQNIYNEGSIYIIEKFIDGNIKNNNYLKAFIEILKNLLDSGNNIIIPFLEICPFLIKSYIESNIDEDKDLNYIEIFKLLKINSLVGNIFILYMNIFQIYIMI